MKKMDKKLEKKEEKVVDTANTDVFVYEKKKSVSLNTFHKEETKSANQLRKKRLSVICLERD